MRMRTRDGKRKCSNGVMTLCVAQCDALGDAPAPGHVVCGDEEVLLADAHRFIRDVCAAGDVTVYPVTQPQGPMGGNSSQETITIVVNTHIHTEVHTRKTGETISLPDRIRAFRIFFVISAKEMFS